MGRIEERQSWAAAAAAVEGHTRLVQSSEAVMAVRTAVVTAENQVGDLGQFETFA